MITFYLRVVFISSRYFFPHACVLMARIPPTASLMVEMRWSDTSAVRRRSCALAEDNRTKYGIRNSRKRTPISACQPIRYTTKRVDTVISVVKGTTWAIYMGASSIHHFHIPHNTPCLPPKICITFVFHFPWVLQSSQEKLKTMLMQNFGGQTRCIMGDVEMANSLQIIRHEINHMASSKIH